MKKFLTGMLVVCLLLTACFLSSVPASAIAASPEEDFDVYDGVLIDYFGDGGDVIIPESLGITEIDSQVFSKCAAAQEIKSVVIPDGVVKIGFSCFEYCANLENVTLPQTLEVLDGCVFRMCPSLKSIAIPGSVKKISGGMFAGDTSLKTIKLEEGIEIVETYAFCAVAANKIVFPSSVYELWGGVANNLTMDSAEFIVMNPDCTFKHKYSAKADDPEAEYMVTFEGTKQYKTRCTVKSLADSNVKTEILKDGEHYSYINFVAVTAEKMQEEYEKQAPTADDFTTKKTKSVDDEKIDNENKDDDSSLSASDKQNKKNETSGEKEDSGNKTLLIVLIAVVAVIVLLVATVVVLIVTGVIGGKKKQKSEKKADIADEKNGNGEKQKDNE